MLAHNPLREQTSAAADIHPENWRLVRLKMDRRGTLYNLAFLRPLTWLEDRDAQIGEAIHLALPEMGLDGPATVQAIEPCPPIAPDTRTNRAVVTGTMKHLAGNLLDVYVAGLEDPIGVTDTHPFWSEDRQTFVPAGQLQVGEHLRRADGTLAQITRITPHRGPPEVVYNLEVDGEHVFHVTAGGVLVHNSCLHETAQSITEKYRGTLLTCEDCARDVLGELGEDGTLVEIQSRFGDYMMVGDDVITRNGRHVAVEVDGKLFVNINPDGVLPLEWINSIDSIHGFDVTRP